MQVTFDTLKIEANIFSELKKNPEWFEHCKNDNSLYIEIRKDNQVNIYSEGGSVARIHYCSKLKKLQVFTHYKYLGLKDSDKTYLECSQIIGDEIDNILENVKDNYSQKKAENGIYSKEKWSEKYIQGNLITKTFKRQHLDSEFAYKDGSFDIRIDLIKVVDGAVTFVELKRMDDARMLKKEGVEPEIIEQMKAYADFIAEYKEKILDYYQTVYDIKKDLKLPLPEQRPILVNSIPELLIFDRWEKSHPARIRHRAEMEKILRENGIEYRIISKL